ncbi:hypothetical protein FE810_14290 [Thalassotalea litorea]|uniref:Uncharacterized protein n=1 Tax=Thalassotalea litorea TaxID=2020715 RepID=A0A5R9IE72_9GAMM|nr:hypothetical protein [Thalassotalea litorea]TLU61673.1 hypothetical protein FE810_14290 [Thalassotalea litorea]
MMKIKEYFQDDGLTKVIMLTIALVFSVLFILFMIFNVKYLLPISFTSALLISSFALFGLGILFWFGYRFIWLAGKVNDIAN